MGTPMRMWRVFCDFDIIAYRIVETEMIAYDETQGPTDTDVEWLNARTFLFFYANDPETARIAKLEKRLLSR
jgi:hypothetical protein